MAKSVKQPIENAADIIEKFGGIRPMAAKINVAVTTIQGWKKRGVIPATRKATILKSAGEHGIDLSKFFDDAPVVRAMVADIIEGANKKPKAKKEDAPTVKTNKLEDDNGLDIPQRMQRMSESAGAGYTEIVYQQSKSVFPKTAFITAGVVFVTFAAIAGTLWPKFMSEQAEREDRIAQLEGEISLIKEDASGFKGFVSGDLMAEIGELKKQATEATGYVGSAVQTFKESSSEFINESSVGERMGQIQQYVSIMSDQSGVYELMNRFDSMRESYNGQESLGNVMLQISQIVSTENTDDESQVNALLDSARAKNEDLNKAFESVPKNELKAAAMLLAMTQVRSSLNRKEEAFDGDLELLMNMVGASDPALHSSLLKLAPHAKAGILTPSGLKEEFQTITGETVAASLRGEDVSFSDKMSAKMNDILQVEKDGEMITGTEAQATVSQAESMIQRDQWEDAVTFLNENLRSSELDVLRPWIKDVQGFITSEKVKRELEKAIDSNFGSGLIGE